MQKHENPRKIPSFKLYSGTHHCEYLLFYKCLWTLKAILAMCVFLQTPGSEFGNDSEMNMHGPRGLSSRVSVTSHGSGGGFSVKDGGGGGHKPRKTSGTGSATFSQSLINLTQVSKALTNC